MAPYFPSRSSTRKLASSSFFFFPISDLKKLRAAAVSRREGVKRENLPVTGREGRRGPAPACSRTGGTPRAGRPVRSGRPHKARSVSSERDAHTSSSHAATWCSGSLRLGFRFHGPAFTPCFLACGSSHIYLCGGMELRRVDGAVTSLSVTVLQAPKDQSLPW